MTANELLKDIKSRKFKPIYLLQGEEEYYIDLIVDSLEKYVLSEAEKGFNQTILYGKDTELPTIINAAKRYPMMAEYQLVIVKEAQSLNWGRGAEDSSKETEILIKYLENPLPSTVLVFAYKHGSIDKRKKVYKSFKTNGVIFQSDAIRDYQIAAWIQDYITQKGYKITPSALNLIAEYLGTDLSKIVNEIDKLCLNVSSETLINNEHIQQNIGISKDFNVFELQKALISRNVLKSNQIINYFADNPKSNPMVLIMANLYGFFSKILKYHYLKNKADAAKELGVNPYFVKDYESASRTFSLPKTFEIINYLRIYDLKSKGLESTGNVDDGELMKELIFKILH